MMVLMTGMATHLPATALELQGLVDLRTVVTTADQSWTRQGLGKLRYDRDNDGLRLGQAFLKVAGDLSATTTAHLLVSAADDRRGVLDVNEAWLAWRPLPTSAWRTRLKAGAFFPATNLEIDYDSVG